MLTVDGKGLHGWISQRFSRHSWAALVFFCIVLLSEVDCPLTVQCESVCCTPRTTALAPQNLANYATSRRARRSERGGGGSRKTIASCARFFSVSEVQQTTGVVSPLPQNQIQPSNITEKGLRGSSWRPRYMTSATTGL